jgi:hypothetical protein
VPESNRIVYWDELIYIIFNLGLRVEIETFYRESRGLGITNVSGMQRAPGTIRLAHSETGWSVAFPPKDEDDRDRIAEILGQRLRFKAVLDTLDRTKHEFLIRHDLTGNTYRSALPANIAKGVHSRHKGTQRGGQ